MPPPTPKGISPGLFNRIKDRIKNELGMGDSPGVTLPQQVDPRDQPLAPALWKKVVEKVRKLRSPPEPQRKQDGPLTPEVIRQRIHQAGRMRVLLLMKYNGVFRHVEPYSFRPAKNGGEDFFGYCRLHDKIHRYKIYKIQALYVTDEPFDPRWDVEVA